MLVELRAVSVEGRTLGRGLTTVKWHGGRAFPVDEPAIRITQVGIVDHFHVILPELEHVVGLGDRNKVLPLAVQEGQTIYLGVDEDEGLVQITPAKAQVAP